MITKKRHLNMPLGLSRMALFLVTEEVAQAAYFMLFGRR